MVTNYRIEKFCVAFKLLTTFIFIFIFILYIVYSFELVFFDWRKILFFRSLLITCCLFLLLFIADTLTYHMNTVNSATASNGDHGWVSFAVVIDYSAWSIPFLIVSSRSLIVIISWCDHVLLSNFFFFSCTLYMILCFVRKSRILVL